MTELSDPRIGTLLEGRYRLAEKLAAGGMGVVYKGELVAIGKPVAVKFLHDAFSAIPDLVKRFQREAQAMSRLAHPHLVSVVDSGLAGGVPFLVMDYVSGRSLADVLADGALPAARAVGLGRQILAGVKAAHAAGVVHRDLKPDNILLLGDVEGDFVKILDFGLAKVVQGSGESATQLTNTGFALGTPGYMSPEQAKGTEADERADLYAVGVILYHMVTGRKPFVADSPLAVLRMHMDDTPTPPTTVARGCCSTDLERVILRAMAKDPNARWQTASDFARALALTPEASVAPAPPAVDDTVPRRPRSWRWLARPALGLVVLGAVAYAWTHLSHREQQKMRRKLDDAVKIAEGAYESVKAVGDQPYGAPPTPGRSPPPKSTPAHPAPPVAAPATRPPPVAAPQPATPAPERPPPSPLASAPPSPSPPLEAKTPPTPLVDDSDEDDEDTVEDPAPPKDTPGAKLEEVSRAAPPPAPPTHPGPARARPSLPKGPTTREARAQLAAGHVDEAIQTLYAVRRHSPHAAPAETALLLGHAYFHKLWRADGLREYDTALKLLPSVRWDHPLVRNTVSALEAANTYRLARAVIRARLGAAALPELRRVARSAKNARTRARAARLAQQLTQAARRR